MRIAVITFFDNGNYGSELQSLAMNRYLQERGHRVTFCQIKAPTKGERILELLSDKIRLMVAELSCREMKLYLKDRRTNMVKQRCISPELKQYIHSFVANYITSKRISRWNFPNKHFDAYICGSDQIWSALKLPINGQLFLSKVSPERKIAYAPSMGLDYLPEYYIRQTKKYISDFKYLSVREDAAKKTIEERFGIDAIQVLDPTMLVGTEIWDNLLLKEGKQAPNFEYVFCYFLGSISDEVTRCVNEIALGMKVIILPYEEDTRKTVNGEYFFADPLDFVNLIKHAKYILTDSFHGSVFSVLYEKQFVVTKRSHIGRVSQMSRISSLLSKFGLNKQYCQQTNEMLNALRTTIDYSLKTQSLGEEQSLSRSFLDNALIEIESSLGK